MPGESDQANFNRRREEFPTLAAGIHLLSHSLGPIPRAARESMLAYCDAWERHTGEDAWATSWWDLSQRVGDSLAKVLGAVPGSVQVQPNASIALATAASCFDFQSGKRNKIVTSALDFPSTEYVWEAQSRLGAKLHIVPSDDGIIVPLERILSAIDESTCLVALSHVSFLSSYRVDAKTIVERAHQQGAMVLLDVYQSAGTVELDATGWGVDFLIGGSIKWLCGGPACGYLYVRPDRHLDLRPGLTGWVAHDTPFEFSRAPMRYANTVRRFAQGTPSIPALYSALAGLQIINEVGIGVIAAESRRRTQWLVDAAIDRSWKVNSPTEVNGRGASVMIGFPDGPTMVTKLP